MRKFGIINNPGLLVALISLANVAVWLFPVGVGAAGTFEIPNISRFDRIEDVINIFLSILRFVVIILLVVAVMYGGFTRLTSQGDADKIAKSQKIIVSAIVGFAIIVLAPVIVQFFGTLLGAQGNLFEFPTGN